jgi:raffinose/stachyose/melibiose transport system substrate-binding protein
MASKILNRRDFLKLSALAGAGIVAASCTPAAAPTAANQAPAATTAPQAADTAAPTEPPPTATPSVPTLPAPAGAKHVTWWGESGETAQEDWLTKSFINVFNSSHTDAYIEYTFQQDLDRVLRTAAQAGSAPDILVTPGPGFVLEYVIAGFPMALDDYAAQYGWKDKLLPWAYASGMVQGKLYSLPLTFESMIVFYNKTLWDKQGWKVPTTGAEMIAICDAAQKAGLVAIPYGNGDWKPATEHLQTMFLDHYAGADNVYKALTGQKKWTDEEFVGTFKMMLDWFKKGYYFGSIDNFHAMTWNDFWPALAQGKGAMIMTGTWGFQGAIPAFKDSGQEWDWFPMPPLRDGVKRVYSLGIGTTLSINKATKNPKEAAEALDYVVNDKKRAMNIASGFSFGEWVIPLQLTPEDFPSDTDKRILKYYDDFVKTTGAGDYGYTSWTFYPAKFEELLYSSFDDVLAGNMTVEAYLDGLQKQFDEDEKNGKIPPVPLRS